MDQSNDPLPSVFDTFGSLGQANDGQDEQPGGLNCELRTYESRYNTRGQRVLLEVGTRSLDTDRTRDHDSAFVLTRIYDQYRELENTKLEIRSPFVKKALQDVITRYPGIEFHAKIVTILGPPKCIFHYREELQAYGTSLEDETAAMHLIFLLEYMYKVFEAEVFIMSTWNNSAESSAMRPMPPRVDFAGLWMAFRPGCPVYTRTNGIDRVLRLKNMSRCECHNPFCLNSCWTIVAQEISFDGDEYGYIESNFYIRKYDGFIGLEKLKVYPLQYHSNNATITRMLVERGKKFMSLQNVHHRYYDGAAEVLSPWRVTSIWGEEDEFSQQTTHVKGRVMIDVKTFCKEKPSNSIGLDDKLDPDKYEHSGSKDVKLCDNDFLICSHTTPGFCFTSKKWGIFKVELLEEITFNTSAFETLLLPKHQKEMIHSLVKVHSSNGLGFDDLIHGKGKGMVFLLHGIPGTGKTLTAEGVADYTQRPLYTVSCGELGISTNEVEENLSKALGLATSWNAIVLIDEADIFLEARSFNDLKRNGLVSIFLRLLEYYQGILILTTNRVSVFDPAIKSRIHLAIKYHALTPESKRDLWRVFITSACSGASPEWLTDECLARLSMDALNGRQIKNTVRTAQALAVSEECELKEKHIEKSLDAMSMFERDFGEVETDVNGDENCDHPEPRTLKRRRLC